MGDHCSFSSNDNNQTNPLYVILSGERSSQSNFCGLSASEQAKARGFSRSGIWLKISVAFHRNVTFASASHQNS